VSKRKLVLIGGLIVVILLTSLIVFQALAQSGATCQIGIEQLSVNSFRITFTVDGGTDYHAWLDYGDSEGFAANNGIHVRDHVYTYTPGQTIAYSVVGWVGGTNNSNFSGSCGPHHVQS